MRVAVRISDCRVDRESALLAMVFRPKKRGRSSSFAPLELEFSEPSARAPPPATFFRRVAGEELTSRPIRVREFASRTEAGQGELLSGR